ncbi:MAG: DUF494 family protein [Neisseria sp.]|nr:DUF494 family protein [Neisseria sp.]
MNITPMFEVFSLLFELFQDSDGQPSRESILMRLMEEGCEPHEIGCAVNCLDTLFYPYAHVGRTRAAGAGSMRIFNWEEQNILPDEVRGLLHFLGKTGNLDLSECEFVTRALMHLPPEEITVDNAKLLTLIRLWNNEAELPLAVNDTLLSIFEEHGGIVH